MESQSEHSGKLAGAKIALGISGGIAAYKSPLLIRLLKKAGADVRVLATNNALQFTTRWTLETLSENPLECDLFPDNTAGTHHIDTAEWADIFVVAPATANIIGKIASGICDDVLTSTLCAFPGTQVIAPAMNTNMYLNPVTQKNINYLRSIGLTIVEPGDGELACGTVGVGRMAEPEEIFARIAELVGGGAISRDTGHTSGITLSGKHILITAGPCREKIDPVRFISNSSSGRMGYALAEAARALGADVTLISGPTALTPPGDVAFVSIETTDELRKAVLAKLPEVDALIMAAAPADFRPVNESAQKIKRKDDQLVVALAPTEDILKEVAALRRPEQLIVGFALETEDLVINAQKKLREKALDAIVANLAVDGDSGPDSVTNRATLISAAGDINEYPLMDKSELAGKLICKVAELISQKQQSHVPQDN